MEKLQVQRYEAEITQVRKQRSEFSLFFISSYHISSYILYSLYFAHGIIWNPRDKRQMMKGK